MNIQPPARASQALTHYPSFGALLEKTRPTLPYYALHPARFRAAAGKFLEYFLDGPPNMRR